MLVRFSEDARGLIMFRGLFQLDRRGVAEERSFKGRPHSPAKVCEFFIDAFQSHV